MPGIVVFAYSEVGHACLDELLVRGHDVRLVATHADDPGENKWFRSVADRAKQAGIETTTLEAKDGDILGSVNLLGVTSPLRINSNVLNTDTGGLVVMPDRGFEDAPAVDLLVVPGGFGTRALMKEERALAWIRSRAANAQRVASVCTGSLVLAEAGLLDGRRATTHWAALDLLESLGRGIRVEREARVVDDGVISSAGVASGMDMALAVVEQRCGRAVAEDTAKYIEYRRIA